DITDEETLCRAVDAIMAQEDHIDVLINNAGFGVSGAVEFTETSDAQRQFDVNFFGMVRLNRLVLPIMRKAGGGRIVNISSVAGTIPIPFQTYYSATKAAINAYTMALANEVRPFGVQVCAVQPGDIRTGFTAAREKVHLGDDVYGGRIARSVSGMERDEQNGMAPETAGRYISRVATKKHIKPIYTIGVVYNLYDLLVRILPKSMLNWIVGLLYAK
ncbi:MAG: SDR family NAD(P)-dependent oxidoreductase, partial [Oscillospiraceae bacterium]|nr:SDR family NAD(P)-dependent oxidoreductase [Oscillospiraceae bacterium]